MSIIKKTFKDKISDSKFVWKQINELCSYKCNNKSSNSIDKISKNGSIIEDKIQISNTINDFFTNIGSDLANMIKSLPNDPKYNDYLGNPIYNSCYFKDITTSEIHSILRTMKNKNLAGPDNLPCSLFIKFKDIFIHPLCFL